MSDRVIGELPIQGLELLFSPWGLPLVDKGAALPSTSIAILGDAGAGKTTLAVALSHAVAKELGGLALYLTTELAPTEIKYKAALLELRANVLNWQDRRSGGVGDIVGQHVALLDDVDQAAPPRRRALEAAWRLVEGSDSDEVRVRCVVVDAFPLPGASSNGSARDEVVALIQAMEAKGISVVIVQEQAGATDFVPFVADIVFELRLEADPDTGERIRKLACPKSRYARSLVGPHDTGVDRNRISVWPDPLALFSPSPTEPLAAPAAIFLPLDLENRHVAYNRGAVLISRFDNGGWLVNVVQRTPGVGLITVNCGPVTRVDMDGAGTFYVPDFEGPYSLAWAVLHAQKLKQSNAVLFLNIEGLLARRRFRTALEHSFEALRSRGLLVCIHGPARKLQGLEYLADFVSDDKYSWVQATPTRRHRSRAAWAACLHWLSVAESDWSGGERDIEVTRSAASTALAAANSGATAAEAISYLGERSSGTETLPEDSRRFPWFQAIVARHLLGAENVARDSLSRWRGDAALAAAAWAHALCGRDWAAADLVKRAISGDADPEPAASWLWSGLTAVHAENTAALSEISEMAEVNPLVLDFAIRGLAVRGSWSEIDALVERVIKRQGLLPSLVDVIRADARLEGGDPVAWEEATNRLAILADAAAVPTVHRALSWHNRGVGLSLLGRHDEAAACWRRALEMNPSLEVAAGCLRAGASRK